MQWVSDNWAPIRGVIYAFTGGILGVLALIGWIDAGTQASLLENAAKLLGALGMGLALLNLSKGGKPQDNSSSDPVPAKAPETVPAYEPIAPKVEAVGKSMGELRAAIESLQRGR